MANVTLKSNNKAPKTIFEPVRAKRRRAGTGCIHKINDTLYEGRISVKENDKKHSKCAYVENGTKITYYSEQINDRAGLYE